MSETLQKTSINYKPIKCKTITEYPFVDIIRFISMIGIMQAHISIFPPNETFDIFISRVDHPTVYIGFMQFFRFSVICFYLISGFLMGDQINRVSRIEYFKRRLNSILNPFLVVLAIFVIAKAISEFYKHDIPISLESMLELFRWTFFLTPLWFLPNYLLALIIILIFLGYVENIAFGILFFCITCVYTYLTVYNHNFEAPHSFAILAYVFYLWLGIYVRRTNSIAKIYNSNIYLIILLSLLLFVVSTFESYRLLHNHFENIFNILRLSNQLYSVIMFILMVKLSRGFGGFSIFNPRKETYGIYLYHGVITLFLLPRVELFLSTRFHAWSYLWYSSNIMRFMLVFICTFIVCYMLTTILVKILIRYELAFLKQS